LNTFDNGLSLKQIEIGCHKVKLLALNDTIIPGQCALKYEKPNKWGIRDVWVCFEVGINESDEDRD